MSDRVQIKIANHVAEVCLNRPEKKNALDTQFFQDLADAGEKLRDNSDVRAVVMYGSGGCFCAGIDTSALMAFAADIDNIRKEMANPAGGKRGNRFQRPTVVWQELKVPVIAAVEGVAFGGGIQLALAADFRLVAQDAKMSIMESKWGIIPDMGISQSLPQLLRADQAKELMMTARVFGAQEALDLGLATRVVDNPVEAAREMAAGLAARSPDAVQGCKELVDTVWGAGDEGLRVEGEIQARIIGYPNQIETVMSQMQKRDAVYE